jgi:hypothetical protein
VKNSLSQKLNCLCIDKRTKDPHTGQTHIVLDRGTKVLLPPNVDSVPALLLVNEKYRVIVGQDIYQYLNPKVESQNNAATGNNGEPAGFLLGNTVQNVMSEQYTFYNMSPDELSSKGRGGMRQMHNYVPATMDSFKIPTPEETYKSDKIGEVSMDSLQQKRNQEILEVKPPMSLSIDSIGTNNTNVYAPSGPPVMDANVGIQPPPYRSQQNSGYGQNFGFSSNRNPSSAYLVNI